MTEICAHIVPLKGFPFFPGDIKDLFSITLKPGHAAAFATDCDLPSTHEMVRSIGMQVDIYVNFFFLLFFVILHIMSENQKSNKPRMDPFFSQ